MTHLPVLAAFLAIPLLVTSMPINAQSNCQAIRFKAGKYSATVKAMAPAEGVRCYTLATGAGQTATFRIRSENGNIAFSIDGVVDAQTDYRFKTKRKTYRMVVFHVIRAPASAPFTMSVSVR